MTRGRFMVRRQYNVRCSECEEPDRKARGPTARVGIRSHQIEFCGWQRTKVMTP